MAAQHIETAQEPMEQEIEGKDNSVLTIHEWLKENKLLAFKQKFDEYQVDVNDLLNYTEDQIDSVMKDCGIITSIHQIRFKNAWRTLQAGKHQNQNRIYRVVMTAKESESMQRLVDKLKEMNHSIQQNTAQTMNAEQNAEKYKHRILSTFEMLRDALNQREQALIKQVNEESNNHLKQLEKQTNALIVCHDLIKQAQNEQNALLLDSGQPAPNREMSIDGITMNALDVVKDYQIKMNTDTVVLELCSMDLIKFMNDIGTVSRQNKLAPSRMIKDCDINNNSSNINNTGNENNIHEMDAAVVNTEHPGNVITNASASIVWYIRNTGRYSFGDHCKLTFVSGDGLLVTQYHIANAKRNEIAKVVLNFTAFSSCGQYEAVFRLSSGDILFGPRLTVTINVINPVIPPKPKQTEKKSWFGWGKKVESVKKDLNVNCICGATMVYGNAYHAYPRRAGRSMRINCNLCNKVCKQNIFYCPQQFISPHPRGYDVCYKCVEKQAAKQQKQYHSFNIAPASTNNNNFGYPSQLKQLVDMGFDEDKSRRLLLKHRGNMDHTLADLIK